MSTFLVKNFIKQVFLTMNQIQLVKEFLKKIPGARTLVRFVRLRKRDFQRKLLRRRSKNDQELFTYFYEKNGGFLKVVFLALAQLLDIQNPFVERYQN